MSLSSRKKLILLKLETTYGDDANPVGANAMLASAVEITPLEAETVDRELIQPHMGATPMLHVGEHIAINFSVENQSSGTVGTAPAFAPALRASGMEETVDATPGSENVKYAPRSEAFEAASIYFYQDNVLHRAVGCRGTFGFGYEPKGLTRLAFKFYGIYDGPVTQAIPTPDWSAFKDPLAVGPAHSSDFVLHGLSAVAHKLDIEAGFEVAYHPTITTEEIRVSDRKSSGSVTIDAPDLGDKDFIELTRTNATGDLSLQHGQTPGNIVVVDAPKVQLLTPKYGEVGGITTLEMGFNLLPETGDDEFTLTYR